MNVTAEIKALLLDLDGTLVDSAPDLLASLNHLRSQRGFTPFSEERLRPAVAQGGRGMLRMGFTEEEHSDPEALLQEFLDHYAGSTFVHSRLYPGMAELLNDLEGRDIPWGVVTNKSERFTITLLREAGLLERTSVVVCGDTLSVSKPDPAPLRLACDLLGLPAEAVAMVGDDARDMQAARAAGCVGYWAGWGYGGPEGDGEHHRTLARPSDALIHFSARDSTG